MGFLTGLFFLLLIGVGVVIAPAFGITWDEVAMRNFGMLSMSYATGGSTKLLMLPERTYGPLFEMILAFLERIFNIGTMHDVTVMRHTVTFLLFALGVWFFYLLGKKLQKSPLMGILGALSLVLSPRIFEDSFVNSKDMPTLALIIIAIHALVRWMEKPTYRRALWMGCAIALAIDVRMVSIILPCFLLLMLALMLLEKRKHPMQQHAPIVRQTIAAFLMCGVTVILFWPFLWTNPISNFLFALQHMSQFPWRGTLFYMGHTVTDVTRPWHYIPVWIAVTTPPLITLFGLLGIGVVIAHLWKTGLHSAINKERLLVLCWCLLPPLVVITLHSTLYDGWRHLYFIYPAFILLSLEGITWLRKRMGTGVIVVVILAHLWTLTWMIRHHPFENVYFAVPAFASSFEQDYWGASYKQGLEWIAAHDPSIDIPVAFLNLPGGLNLWMLPEADYNRFSPDPEHPHYFLTNYRDHYHEPVEGKEVYVIDVNGEKIMGVYER